jgi:hypothetical protein
VTEASNNLSDKLLELMVSFGLGTIVISGVSIVSPIISPIDHGFLVVSFGFPVLGPNQSPPPEQLTQQVIVMQNKKYFK